MDDPWRRFAVGMETSLAQEIPPAEAGTLAAANDFPGGPSPRTPLRQSTRSRLTPPSQAGTASVSTRPRAEDFRNCSQSRPGGRISPSRSGSHTDQLWHLDSWERIPGRSSGGSRSRRLPRPRRPISLGGLIYIDVPGRAALSGSRSQSRTRSPRRSIAPGSATHADWRTKLGAAPGPWAELWAST